MMGSDAVGARVSNLSEEKLTRQRERAIRDYDPRISCATRSLEFGPDRG
jgi:coenzyme F420-reducing hydrogenase alpha subunit